jgi:hypothetical protein
MGTVRDLKEVDGGWELTVEASTVLEDVKVTSAVLLPPGPPVHIRLNMASRLGTGSLLLGKVLFAPVQQHLQESHSNAR